MTKKYCRVVDDLIQRDMQKVYGKYEKRNNIIILKLHSFLPCQFRTHLTEKAFDGLEAYKNMLAIKVGPARTVFNPCAHTFPGLLIVNVQKTVEFRTVSFVPYL